MPRLILVSFLVAALLPASASAVDLDTSKVEVTFHIEHPAKEYDAFLLPGGGAGRIRLDPAAIERTTATFSIKVAHFNSDNTRRDSHMLEVLEGLVFPTIEWTVTAVTGATGPVRPGTHKLVGTGPITLHGVTRALTVPLELTVGGKGELTIGAAFEISLEAFGIERPTMVFVPITDIVPIIVKVDTGPNAGVLVPAGPAPTATPPGATGPGGAPASRTAAQPSGTLAAARP